MFSTKPQTSGYLIQVEKIIGQRLLPMPMYPSQRPGPGSSVRADGTTDLPQRPTHCVVDVLFVCLVHGDVLQSEGVGLGGLASAWEATWHVMGEGRACIVVVFEGRQVVVHAVLLTEHGEGLLLGDQVVHQFGQGVGELLMGEERSSVVPFLRWVGRGTHTGERAGHTALVPAVPCGCHLFGVGDDGFEGRVDPCKVLSHSLNGSGQSSASFRHGRHILRERYPIRQQW